jgi:hypothetical protein
MVQQVHPTGRIINKAGKIVPIRKAFYWEAWPVIEGQRVSIHELIPGRVLSTDTTGYAGLPGGGGKLRIAGTVRFFCQKDPKTGRTITGDLEANPAWSAGNVPEAKDLLACDKSVPTWWSKGLHLATERPAERWGQAEWCCTGKGKQFHRSDASPKPKGI